MIVARDIAHAKLKERIDRGEGLPQYVKDHPIYYAGPAKTPEGYASGSFGPTTAGRMDSYVDLFMQHGGSFVTLAKGNRSPAVAEACKKHGGFYLGSIGGPAAILAQDNITQGRGARVPRARHGSDLEDRGRGLPRLHRRRRQGQRLLRQAVTRIRSLPAYRRHEGRRGLQKAGHVVYRLAPDLLLVFKPRGHVESDHVHPYTQHVRVLRGRLEIRTPMHVARLGPRGGPLRIAARQRHATRALTDTWLIVESGGAARRRTVSRRRGGGGRYAGQR